MAINNHLFATFQSSQRQWFIWLPLLALCVWLPSLYGSFQFDDYNVIVDFAPVHSLSAWWASQPSIRPLLKLSYTLNWLISPSPFNFHVFNVVVHSCNGVLFYHVLKRHFAVSPLFVLMVVLLWFLHPAQTEAISYIAGRSVSLSTTFLLIALVTIHTPNRGRYVAAFATLCALLTRETAWIFPAVYTLMLWLDGDDWHAIKHKVLPSLLIVCVAVCAMAYHPYYNYLLQTSLSTRSLSSQLLTQISAYDYFFRQPIFVLTPNIDPDLSVIYQTTQPLLLKAFALLCVIVWSAYRVITQRCWRSGGVIWFFLLLLPTNSLLPRLDIANDRHLYASLMGLAWLIGLLLIRFDYAKGLMASLIVVLACATLIRNEDYHSELALWARTSEQSPQKSRVWNNLGIACQRAQQRDCALFAYQKAMLLDANNTKAGNNWYFLQHSKP